MAWTTMHFAVGMGCAGAIAGVGCMVLRRGWRWLPAAMTVGGLWALIPDMPRIFREDFYYEPISSILGTQTLERSLHRWGDLFFFHRALDAQPKEFALLGMLLILMLYNAGIILLMAMERRQRHSAGQRAGQAHTNRKSRKRRRRSPNQTQPPPNPITPSQSPLLDPCDDQPAVIYRIRPSRPSGTEDGFH